MGPGLPARDVDPGRVARGGWHSEAIPSWSVRQRLASKIVEFWRILPCRGVCASVRGLPCGFGNGAPKRRVDRLPWVRTQSSIACWLAWRRVQRLASPIITKRSCLVSTKRCRSGGIGSEPEKPPMAITGIPVAIISGAARTGWAFDGRRSRHCPDANKRLVAATSIRTRPLAEILGLSGLAPLARPLRHRAPQKST